MFEQTFKNLDDIMFQVPGCNTELGRTRIAW